MRRLRPDDGSMLPLTACFGALVIALVVIVTAATSLYLERKRLFTLADAAALAAAESFSLDDVELTQYGPRPTLHPHRIRAAVADLLTRMPAGGVDDLRVAEATTTDGRTASVTLTSRWRPPVVALFLPHGVSVEVTSVARAVFG